MRATRLIGSVLVPGMAVLGIDYADPAAKDRPVHGIAHADGRLITRYPAPAGADRAGAAAPVPVVHQFAAPFAGVVTQRHGSASLPRHNDVPRMDGMRIG